MESVRKSAHRNQESGAEAVPLDIPGDAFHITIYVNRFQGVLFISPSTLILLARVLSCACSLFTEALDIRVRSEVQIRGNKELKRKGKTGRRYEAVTLR